MRSACHSQGYDICAAEPEKAARRLVDRGFTKRYDYALQTLTDLPYASWREFDPEDSMRFYALRLHEVGMINLQPERAPRRGHRLAFSERAQARAEGVSQAAAKPSVSALFGLQGALQRTLWDGNGVTAGQPIGRAELARRGPDVV